MPEAVIVSALRTPIGTAMKGTLRDTDAYQLADHVVGSAVADLDGGTIDEIILGEGLYGGMEHHPLTPMTDANLVRVLSRQTDGKVGLVPYASVEQGAGPVRTAMTLLQEQGHRYAIVDAVNNAHLLAIGEAAEHHALITGGSGVAMGLPANFRRAGLLPRSDDASALPKLAGHAAVLAGSCSGAGTGRSSWSRSRAGTAPWSGWARPAGTSWALGPARGCWARAWTPTRLPRIACAVASGDPFVELNRILT